ncbi:hypothetical protein [Streptomyces sp. 11x1]|nr:hypothetical protein [Streptomyces sp. 11x1]WNZ13366.1 hypothetical protein P8T65_41250 [Streptomyces sp. 11x1]
MGDKGPARLLCQARCHLRLRGQTLTDTGITVTPNVDQPGRTQFTER